MPATRLNGMLAAAAATAHSASVAIMPVATVSQWTVLQMNASVGSYVDAPSWAEYKLPLHY